MPARRLPALPLALAAALLLLWTADARAAEPDPERAKTLIDQGRPADAVPLLEAAVAEAPASARLHFLLGVAYHRSGRPEQAIPHFEEAVALDPADGRARYNLGAAYFAVERWQEAARAFAEVPERAPDMAAAAWLNAGLAVAKQGRRDEARALFARAVAAEPEGRPAETARRMLALLAWTEPAGPEGAGEAGAEAAADVAAAERRGPARAWRQALHARLEAGLEYDTNVFSLPDDTATTEEHDWRGAVRARVDTRVPLGAVRLTPRYDFYGHFYDKQTTYDYLRHRLLLRADWRGPALEPRLEYAYAYSELGADPYLDSHSLGTRVALRRAPGRRLWAGVAVRHDEAPLARYDYLSGTTWEGTLSAFGPAGEAGELYGSLTLRTVDRGTVVRSTYRASYSYTGFEPYVYYSRPLPWRMDFTGTFRYEYRRYTEADTWTSGPGGRRHRQDHRVTATLAVSRPLSRWLEVEAGWQGQVRESNIGNRMGDYADRDFTREVMGVFLRGEI